MSLPQIRDEYRVPARLGQRVSIRTPLTGADGSLIPLTGTITGSENDRLVITPDPGSYWPDAFRAHPTQLTFHPTTEEN